jgi:hypothetical protein
MLRFITKNLKWFFTGTFAMVLAACYGAPVDMRNEVSVQGTDSLNNPIPGLKMSLYNNGSKVSDDIANSDGKVFYPNLREDQSNNFTVKIEDTDGVANGGQFKPTEVDIVTGQMNYTEILKH